VSDEFLEDNNGEFEIANRSGEVTCERSGGDQDADLEMDVAELSSAYLGGVKFSTMARAGQVRGSEKALALADLMFSAQRLPFCSLYF
jgi:predicted acetyltransferase